MQKPYLLRGGAARVRFLVLHRPPSGLTELAEVPSPFPLRPLILRSVGRISSPLSGQGSKLGRVETFRGHLIAGTARRSMWTKPFWPKLIRRIGAGDRRALAGARSFREIGGLLAPPAIGLSKSEPTATERLRVQRQAQRVRCNEVLGGSR